MNVNFKSLFIFGLGLTSTGVKLADRSSTEVDNNNVLGPGVVKEGASFFGLGLTSAGAKLADRSSIEVDNNNVLDPGVVKEGASLVIKSGGFTINSVLIISDGGNLVIPDGGNLVIPDGGNLVLK